MKTKFYWVALLASAALKASPVWSSRLTTKCGPSKTTL